MEQDKSSDIEQQPPFKQKWHDFMEHRFDGIQDTTYYQTSVLLKGDDVTEAKKKKMCKWLFYRCCFI